jgi:hypothetical protein
VKFDEFIVQGFRWQGFRWGFLLCFHFDAKCLALLLIPQQLIHKLEYIIPQHSTVQWSKESLQHWFKLFLKSLLGCKWKFHFWLIEYVSWRIGDRYPQGLSVRFLVLILLHQLWHLQQAEVPLVILPCNLWVIVQVSEDILASIKYFLKSLEELNAKFMTSIQFHDSNKPNSFHGRASLAFLISVKVVFILKQVILCFPLVVEL